MSYTYKHHTTAIQNIQVPAIKIATVRIQNRTLHLILRNMFLYISWPNNINSLPTTEKKYVSGIKSDTAYQRITIFYFGGKRSVLLVMLDSIFGGIKGPCKRPLQCLLTLKMHLKI